VQRGSNEAGAAKRGHMASKGTKAADDAWVERLAVLILVLALLYAIVGIPSLDRDAAVATDYVNPLNRWVWLGLLAMSMPILSQRWREVASLAMHSWALLLLFGYFALSTTWALDPDTSVRRLIFSLVQLVLFIIVLSGMRRPPLLHVVIAGVCVVIATLDLASWVVMPGYAMTSDGFAGLQLQKNQTGLLMMYGCLSAGCGVFLLQRRLHRWALASAVVMMAALLVATRSTTSQSIIIMAPIVVPVILLIARLPNPVIYATVATGLLVLATAAFGYLAWCGATGTDPMLPLRGVTFTGRTDLWSFVSGEIAKRPWFGAGYSSFWAINPAVQPSLKTDQWFGVYVIINEAHEGYLDLLATGGVVGLAGGLFVLFRTIGMAFRAITRTAPAARAWQDGTLAYPTAVFHLALLLGLVVHNFTESNLFSNNSVLAVAFLLCALDLERWQIGARRAAAARVRPIMRAAPAAGAAGASRQWSSG
jgi:exopolysaccharide production protein ExoQ